ncbi:PEP-CTERM sorting domain-containing protein [Chitiniphilus purpureus]|uniref:PEP-CTERM sorting domain-containing protein n=1 Tax=Chitiniphilus purpureus TaxID=2981137 RepID=A0ABY6DL52_9NEIS|nr:PEP-CTERM sorting domain-containing protein [Chitiniphilus sp. CD1]UXY15089.1 PEP-CTERM sorting domain-containing protein [Chitiniphilus sp. CD1]
MKLFKLLAMSLLMTSAAAQAAYTVFEAEKVRYYVDMDSGFMQGLTISLNSYGNLVFTPADRENILEASQRGHGKTGASLLTHKDFLMAEAKGDQGIFASTITPQLTYWGVGQMKPQAADATEPAFATVNVYMNANSLTYKNDKWVYDDRWGQGYSYSKGVYASNGESYTSETLHHMGWAGGFGSSSTFAGRVGISIELYASASLINPVDRNSSIVARLPSFSVGLITRPVSPIPEPESYALMGLGLVGLVAMRRRRPV